MAREGGSAQPRPTRRASVGVVAVQAVNSLTTVVVMALFAIVLSKSDFDDFAVWATAGMMLVGLAQAVGSDRVLVGRRSQSEGGDSALVLGVAAAGLQAVIAVLLGSLPLLVASAGLFAYVTYDYRRLIESFTRPTWYLKRDVLIVTVQVAIVLAVWLRADDGLWLVLCWWIPGALLWAAFGEIGRGLRHRMGHGLRILREDRREGLPLLADAALAGLPLVAALALVLAQGAPGSAAEARMAITLLGPVTVLGIAGRRVAYQRAAHGEFSRRFTIIWGGVVGATLVICAALLAVSRTPIYPWIFDGFVGLGWWAVLGFAVNHAALFATLLPAARLRATGQTHWVSRARVLAVLTFGVLVLAVMPINGPTEVAWTLAGSSLTYAVALALGAAVVRRRGAEAASPTAPMDPAAVVGEGR